MINVLFVCLGNICRSPMAEAVFRHMIQEHNLHDKIYVDSAGTASWHTGDPPHEGTRKKLAELNIPYEGMRARQVQEEDFQKFHYIIAMDDNNIADLQRFAVHQDQVVVRKLLDFVPGTKEDNVPDPYYTGDFDYTYELVSEACNHLLNHLVENHDLKG